MTRTFVPACLLVAFAQLATAQPGTAPRGTVTYPITIRLLPFITGDGMVKALKLTPEQTKAFRDYRKKLWDEEYTTPSDKFAESAAVRNNATVEFFKSTLSEEQFKRSQQLAVQYLLSGSSRGQGVVPPEGEQPSFDTTRVPASVVSLYPEVATQLQLTEEQKKIFATRVGGFVATAPTVFLTREQTKALQGLIGEPARLDWTMEFDVRLNRVRGLSGFPWSNVSGLFGLVQAKDVRTELGLTTEQDKALMEQIGKWTKLRYTDRTRSPEANANKFDELKKQSEEFLNATLKPDQMKRLKQIAAQDPLAGWFGSPMAAPSTPSLSVTLNKPTVRKAIALTDVQTKSLTGADTARDKAVEAAVLSDIPTAEVSKAVAAANEAREKAYAAVITAEQKLKMEELLGKPFRGSPISDRERTVRTPPLLVAVRKSTFGKRTLAELRVVASNEEIQQELGLKPEQIKSLMSKAQELSRYGSFLRMTTEADTAKASDAIVQVLKEILTADQMKRFDELMIQRAESLTTSAHTGTINSSPGAVVLPGVAEAVKLTEEQKTKILDESVSQNDVLTAGQKATIKTLGGKPYSGSFIIASAPFVTPFSAWSTVLPTTETVLRNVPAAALKFTPEQHDAVAMAMNAFQLEAFRLPADAVGGGGFSRTNNPQAIAAANENLDKAVAAILSAEQLSRIEQVEYQFLSVSNGPAVYTLPPVVKALELTPEQIEKMSAAIADLQQRTSAGGQPFFFALGVNSFNPGAAWVKTLNDKLATKITAVLTEQQKQKWRSLTGEPVPNLPILNPAGGRVGGGFGVTR